MLLFGCGVSFAACFRRGFAVVSRCQTAFPVFLCGKSGLAKRDYKFLVSQPRPLFSPTARVKKRVWPARLTSFTVEQILKHSLTTGIFDQ